MSVHLGNLRTWTITAVVGLVLSLNGCGDEGAPEPAHMGAAATPTALPQDPMAGAPVESSCFRMTPTQARAVTMQKAAVDCYDTHTSMTYHVGLFPEGTVRSDPDIATRGCRKNLTAKLELTRKQLDSSFLDVAWFEPTTVQWAAGARWYRCDVVAWNEDQTRLLKLPETSYAFDDGIPDELARCKREGSDSEITCDRPHQYRWAGTFEGKGAQAPTKGQATAMADSPCDRLTGQDGGWYVTWYTGSTWTGGEHTMTCWKKTSA